MPAYFARTYAEAFPKNNEIVTPLLRRAMSGEKFLLPAQRAFIHREGRFRDAWFDISYTGVYEMDGTAVGVHYIYIERTQEVLSARRLETLNALGRAPRGSGRRQAIADALAVLDDAEDVPFAAAYLLDATERYALLVAATGVNEGEALAPRELRRARGAAWPLDQVVQTNQQLLVHDLDVRFRGHLVGPDAVVPERAIVHPLRDGAGGKVIGVLVLGISPRTQLDDLHRAFLTLAGDTIGARAAEAHAAQRERQRLDRLAELDRVKTEFFSNVSHEFRTPLTLLLAPLQQALRRVEELPPDVVTDLEVAERNARRLLRLVGSLLDFSQLEAGRLNARFVPTDLTVLTTEIASMFSGAAEAAGLKLVVDVHTLPELVWVDREMWEKVVSNLVSNALKFTWEGTVEVSLRALPKHAELVVRDTGVGIPADQLPHVFKRFHRVLQTRGRTYEGAGIGLALVHELVRHHGRVRATSCDAGTTLTAWLPFGRRPQRDVQAPPSPRAGNVAAAMADEARHWDAARAEVRDREPDEELPANLIRYAPGARIRATAGQATTPVVLLTARAGEETAIEGVLAGADDYVVKPFTARELVARVGAQLELAQLRHRHAELDAFRLALTDTLRRLADPTEMQARAAELVGRHLGASRAYYQEFDHDAGTFTIHRNYTDGLPSLAGTYRLDDYGRDLVDDPLRAGRPLVVRDSANLDETEAAAWAALSVRAGLSAPNLGGGVCVAALGVTSATPRDWTDEEVALVEETADRTWAFVERARAEAELRESEQRFRTLADTAPALIWHIDAAGISRARPNRPSVLSSPAAAVGWRSIATGRSRRSS
jgi:signal transduction histidine kinase/CheY-like chemotaxis protein